MVHYLFVALRETMRTEYYLQASYNGGRCYSLEDVYLLQSSDYSSLRRRIHTLRKVGAPSNLLLDLARADWNSVCFKGSGGVSKPTNKQPWQVLHFDSTCLSIPAHQTLLRSLCFVFVNPISFVFQIYHSVT